MCGIMKLGDLTLGTADIPPLPSEIIDLVIDQLREDRAALQSCSLVCRDWVPRARYHLFFIFNVRSRASHTLHLLQSPLCTIHPRNVHGLKFCVDPSEIAPMVALIREIDARSTLLILRMRTSPGAGLTLMDDALLAFLPKLKNLRHLKLHYFYIENPEHRVGLLAALPALESLMVYGVDSHDDMVDSHSEDGQDSLYAVPPPANLRHIFIGTIGASHELRWLTVHCGHPLTTLHLHNLTPESLLVVLDYLRRSSHLQCLSFDFCTWETSESLQRDLVAQIDLTSHQDLRCLRVTSAEAFHIISGLLPRVRSSCIEEITMATGGNHSMDFTWADLHKTFIESPAVRNLKRLYVDEEEVFRVLEVLPELASRGVILPLCEGRGTTELSLSSILYT